jgi:hypothetical protein
VVDAQGVGGVSGRAVSPAYGTTVQELNANSLYNWLEEFGAEFNSAGAARWT